MFEPSHMKQETHRERWTSLFYFAFVSLRSTVRASVTFTRSVTTTV